MPKKLLNFFFPKSCTVCQCDLETDRSFFCVRCDPFTNRFHQSNLLFTSQNTRCYRCGEPCGDSASEKPICAVCEAWPPASYRMRSIGRYTRTVENAVKACKYWNRRQLLNYFAEVIGKSLQSPQANLFPDTAFDFICAIPSSKDIVQDRGFGHMSIIARKAAKIAGIPYQNKALTSPSNRTAQAKVRVSKRKQNIQDAFEANPRIVKGKTILLLDDVMTTGATVLAGTTSLLDAGAKQVDVLTIARSERFNSFRLMNIKHTDNVKTQIQ